jgi:transglutaminase-like putative cysteine protease
LEPAPFELRAEEPAYARDLGFAVDLDAPTFGAVDRPLGDPADVVKLRLRVLGLDRDLSSDGVQRSASLRGDRVVVVDPTAAADGAPLPHDEARLRGPPRRYVSADVAATAARVVDGASDAGEKIALLTAWVRENLAKTPFADAETAEEVLRRGAGDASEHALLFAALALSVGVPAREIGGLRYGGDAYGRFHWHVWNEAHDGARWIAVDPTYGLAPADAARVRFTEAPDDPRWPAEAARCRFEAIDWEKR